MDLARSLPNYDFPCAWCQEDGDVKDQHNYLLVFDEDEAGLVPGVYRITGHPYSTSTLIGEESLDRWHIQYIGALPSTLNIKRQWYPCGHLCHACQGKMLKELVQRGYSLDIR